MEPGNNNLPDADLFEEEPANDGGARRRWPWAAAIVALALAVVGAGVAVAGNMRPAGEASGPASSAVTAPSASALHTTTSPAGPESATPSATTTTAVPTTSAPATSAPAAEDWRTFTSSDSKVSFEYPATWRVTDTSAAGGVDVDVANEDAVVVASLHVGPSGGLGGACQGPVPYAVLDSVEVNLPYQPSKGSVTPRFAFRALQEAGRVTASYGLTSTVAGQNGKTCMFYNVVDGPAESPLYFFADAVQVNVGSKEEDPKRKGAKTFPTMEAARAYMDSPEYRNAKRMITSLKINEG